MSDLEQRVAELEYQVQQLSLAAISLVGADEPDLVEKPVLKGQPAHVSAKDYSRKHVTMQEFLLYEALGDEEYRKAAKSGRLQAMLDRMNGLIDTELTQN